MALKLILKFSIGFAVTMVCLASALADPPPDTYRFLAAAGSETTQEVMNAIANNQVGYIIDNLASYNATQDGDATDPGMVTRPPANSIQEAPITPCALARARVSLDSIYQLDHSIDEQDDCLHVARATFIPTDTEGTISHAMIFYPFATDGATYVIRSDSTISRRLSKANLATIFTCGAPALYKPLLPTYGSGLRRNFLNFLGLLDSPTFVQDHPCVNQVQSNIDGRGLTDPGHIMPFSVANYIAQVSGVTSDLRGSSVLGTVDAQEPLMPSLSVTYAIRSNSTISRRLTTVNLATIYNCQASSLYKPLLPPYGSTLRSTFLQLLGFTDSANFVSSRPCISEVDATGAAIQDNNGTQFTDPGHIAPYNVDQYLGQIFGRVTDSHGLTLLGSIDQQAPFQLNSVLPLQYQVYNVVSADQVIVNAEERRVRIFDGPTSVVCSNSSVIRKYGFNLIGTQCGGRIVRPAS